MSSLKKATIKNLLILTAFLTSSIFLSSICLALEIRVKDRSEIDGDMVYLRDIATFSPANDSRVDKLQVIEITTSPAPDSFRKINKDFILYKTARFTNAEQDITLTSPDTVIIERTAQVVSEETLKEIFQDYVMDNAPWERDQIAIDRINSPPSIALPKGDLDWEVHEKQNNNFIGNFSIMIDFRVDGDSLRKIIVSGKISVFKDVIKAARNINRGDIITSQDITMVSEKIKYFRKDLVRSTKEVIGKRATRRIQADQTIKSGMFEIPPAIEKGDIVVIKAENNELLITATGKALEEGCLEDQIRVVNTSSGREITATVKGTELVVVQF